MRGNFEDDEVNAWREWLFLNVPAFQQLASDSNLRSRNSRGNVVEACIGASFLAAHEFAATGATMTVGVTMNNTAAELLSLWWSPQQPFSTEDLEIMHAVFMDIMEAQHVIPARYEEAFAKELAASGA